MAALRWKEIQGTQGSWNVRVFYTDGSTEILPTAHQYFWKGRDRYERGGTDDPTWPEYRARPQFPDHVALLRQTKRVALTKDRFDLDGVWQRKGYVGVYDIDDIKVDDAGMSYRFVNRIPKQQ